jgi:hypothetical protein
MRHLDRAGRPFQAVRFAKQRIQDLSGGPITTSALEEQ